MKNILKRASKTVSNIGELKNILMLHFSLLDRQIALITLNAFVSTLGGGYFLCRRIEEAERMASYQHRVALWLGDPILASQCRIHLIYNCIQR